MRFPWQEEKFPWQREYDAAQAAKAASGEGSPEHWNALAELRERRATPSWPG